jgi:DNA-binding SARP family transcriptional activator
MALLEVQTLGGPVAVSAVGGTVSFPTRKTAALCAYLAVEARRQHGREELATLLWPDATERQGRANLRKTLSRLRQALPEEARVTLQTTGEIIAFDPAAVMCDLARFQQALETGDLASLEAAASLYRGSFLASLRIESEAFESWTETWRRFCEERVQEALRRLLEHYVTAGRIELAVRTAVRLLAFDPLQEAVHRTLIRLYLHQERYGAALAQYRRCRETLDQELGAEPEVETEALHDQILGDAPRRDEAADAPVPVVEPAAGLARGRATLRQSDLPSIAVLPFSDLSPGSDASHLAVGLTEEVIIALTRFRELQVIAPHSAFAYQATGMPPERAGAELGVRYRLEGGLQLAGERLRVTARLVENDGGRHLWAERFEEDHGDIFALQDEVTRRIVSTLVGRIEGERLREVQGKSPLDWEAQDFWLKGREALRRVDFRSIARARHYFQRAIEKEADFARAYSGLAMTEIRGWSYFNWQPAAKLGASAYRYARKAVQLDADDHQTHCILGFTYLVHRDFEAARRHLDRALELNPNDAQTLAHVCVGLALMGEPERGAEAGELALRLDPYHPDWYVGSLGCARFVAHAYEEAVEILTPAPQALCDSPAYLAAAHAFCGRPQEARPYRELVVRLYRQRQARGQLAESASCLDWLMSINPFRRTSDAEHFVSGLRKADFGG